MQPDTLQTLHTLQFMAQNVRYVNEEHAPDQIDTEIRPLKRNQFRKKKNKTKRNANKCHCDVLQSLQNQKHI